MKICFFLENNKAGGLDTFVKNLLVYWPNRNDELVLFSNNNHPGNKFLKEFLLKNKIKIYIYETLDNIDIGKSIQNKIFRYLNNIIFFNKKIHYFYELFKKNKFDRLIFIQGGYPGGQSSNAAIFAWDKFSEHKPWFNFHNFVSKTRRWDLFRLFLNFKISQKVKGFISVSRVCMHSINNINFFKKMSKKFIYNGIEYDYSKNFKKKRNKNISLLMLGVYEERKGHKFLFDSLLKLNKKYKNFKCEIYGDGNAHEIYTVKKKIPKELKNKIFLNQHVSYVKKIIEKSDIILVPSQKLESFGYSALEAMACGKPLVSTNCGGLVELIKNNTNGYIINKNNITGFSEKIYKLIVNKELRYKMGKEGYRRYNKFFRSKSMSKKYAKLILS